MHEYPITEQLIKIAQDHCEKAKGKSVKTIHLVVGEYSGFVPESIHMYFDLISEGTLCEGAQIEITRIKPKLRCLQCGIDFDRKGYSFQCPDCGGQGGPSEIGKEFYIESIEVND